MGKITKAPGGFLGKIAKLDKLPGNTKCPLSGREKIGAKYKLAVALCCGNCQKKYAAEPLKYIGKVEVPKED